MRNKGFKLIVCVMSLVILAGCSGNSSCVWEDSGLDAKPAIYLYPEQETDIRVELDYNGDVIFTYPKYNNGWNVKANSNGEITDTNGNRYNYLFWEGKSNYEYKIDTGFCIEGGETIGFLENKLAQLGLNDKEISEFIVYWGPRMQENEYNIIKFIGEEYTNNAKLNIEPTPDTIIRVFMVWEKSDEFVDIEEQIFSDTPKREGFTVVEWGGRELI